MKKKTLSDSVVLWDRARRQVEQYKDPIEHLDRAQIKQRQETLWMQGYSAGQAFMRRRFNAIRTKFHQMEQAHRHYIDENVDELHSEILTLRQNLGAAESARANTLAALIDAYRLLDANKIPRKL